MKIRRLAAAALAALLALVALMPATAAASDEPLLCKLANGVSKRVTGDDIMYCIDDPNDPW